MMILPISVFVRPVSTSTAYTTASEVVLSATPAICAAGQLHPRTWWQTNMAPRNGPAKERTPMSRLSLDLSRRIRTSTSAPARNVSRIPPRPATNLTHSSCCNPRKFPPITPSVISMMAAESPSSTEITLARRIRAASTTATYRSMDSLLVDGSIR